MINKALSYLALTMYWLIKFQLIVNFSLFSVNMKCAYSGVRGFASVDEHSNTLKTLDEIFEGNRLDYDNTAFKTGSGVDGISKSVGDADTVYGKITYVLDDVDGVKIPEEI